MADLKGALEAVLFAGGDPLTEEQLREILQTDLRSTRALLTALSEELSARGSGLMLKETAGGWQMVTRPELFSYVERLSQETNCKLSRAAMETLSIIAFKQPVTKLEIEQIRGVKCDYSVQSLLNKGLIEEQGRLETLGRPILYGTTDAFLRHFGISSLEELPEIDFNRLADKLSSDADSDAEEGQKTLGDGETAVQP